METLKTTAEIAAKIECFSNKCEECSIIYMNNRSEWVCVLKCFVVSINVSRRGSAVRSLCARSTRNIRLTHARRRDAFARTCNNTGVALKKQTAFSYIIIQYRTLIGAYTTGISHIYDGRARHSFTCYYLNSRLWKYSTLCMGFGLLVLYMCEATRRATCVAIDDAEFVRALV